jgi:alkylation response protein AidB-like acyl-CoA dehydrogenase
MDFEYSAEKLELQDSLVKYLSKNYTFDHRRSYSKEGCGYSQQVWTHLAEIGVLGLTFAQKYGGLADDLEELVLPNAKSKNLGLEQSIYDPALTMYSFDSMWVLETLGKYLCLEPYLSTVVMAGATILSAGTHKQKEQLIPLISSGDLRISIAHHEPMGRYQNQEIKTKAELVSGAGQNTEWLLSGSKCVVLGANASQKLLVSAMTQKTVGVEFELSLFLLSTDAPGVSLTTYETHEGGRASDISLVNVRVSEEDLIGGLSAIGHGQGALEEMIARGNAGLCAEAVGIMSTMCDLTLGYLKTRQQFGVPIGKFQALQHRMADMIILCEQAKSMAMLAAQAQGNLDFKKKIRDTSAAKAYICQSARTLGQEAIQLHGGMGVTDEMSVGHYFKRLTLITQTLGDFNHHIEIVGDYLKEQATPTN